MADTNTGRGAFIETNTGAKFYPYSPKPEDVRLLDIAESLSKQCRYTGHTYCFYSVAEHSAILSLYAMEQGMSRMECLTVLLHDASETYMADVARPVKSMLPEYKAIEEKIHEAVAKKFGTIYPQPDWLKLLDARIIMDERAQVMNPSNNDWKFNFEPLGVDIVGLDWRDAKEFFLSTYDAIFEMGDPQ